MNVAAELETLHKILRKALEQSAPLGPTIAEFLRAYDALPDAFDAERSREWQAMHNLAYELRYYAPDDAAGDDTLLDDAAALSQIREVVEGVA